MTSPAVELRDVFRVYAGPEGGVVALQGLTLDVRAGEICVVLGPSGSGKSTLLRLLAALDSPTAGRVRVLGHDLSRLGRGGRADYRAQVLGYADQHYWQALAPELEVRELVGMQLGLSGMARHERYGRAGDLLERVGLLDRADARPAELSGGEQQRVAICAALAHGPRLLLADEPTGELDAVNARLVYEAIAELARGAGTTTVLVSHDPESASVADRIVRVRDGRVSEEAALADGRDESIVVGRGGWLRLSEELLRRTGIRSHAAAHLHEDGILLQAAAHARHPDRDSGGGAASRDARDEQDGRRDTGPVPHLRHRRGGRRRARRARSSVRRRAPRRGDRTLGLRQDDPAPSAGGPGPADGRRSAGPRGARVCPRPRRPGALPRRARSPRVAGRRTRALPHRCRERGAGPLPARRRLRRSPPPVQPRHWRRSGWREPRAVRVSDLSSGQRERVAVARAVASRPALLLADEPTARLDQANAVTVARLLLELARETGAAVVCATHDPILIEHADDVLDLGARRRAASVPL